MNYSKLFFALAILLFFPLNAFGFACSGSTSFELQFEEASDLYYRTPEEINSLQDIKSGLVLAFEGSNLDRMAESVPVVIKLKTSTENNGKIYYALASEENYFSGDEYAGFSLFNWVDGLGKNLVDGYQSGFSSEECENWVNRKDCYSIDLAKYDSRDADEIELYTATALPKGTHFVLLCSQQEVKVKAYYFDDSKKTYNAGKGIYNGGAQFMVPLGFTSKNSTNNLGSANNYFENVIESIEEQKACLEKNQGLFEVKWNLAGKLEGILASSQDLTTQEEREEEQGNDDGEELAEEEDQEPEEPDEPGEPAEPAEPAEPVETGAFSIREVYFFPGVPTTDDSENLACYADIAFPEGFEGEAKAEFLWKLNGESFFTVTKNVGPDDEGNPFSKPDSLDLEEGQEFECSVIVSAGEQTAGPKTATVKILEGEERIGDGKGEEQDTDNDGFPDTVDKCPNEYGEGLDGCPVEDDPGEEPTEEPTEQPTEQPTEEPTEQPTEQPTEEPTEEPANAEVTFIGIPMGWQGSQAEFETEFESTMDYFLEKSGLTGCKRNYNFVTVSKGVIENNQNCAGLNDVDACSLGDNAMMCLRRQDNYNLTLLNCLESIEAGGHIRTSDGEQWEVIALLTDLEFGTRTTSGWTIAGMGGYMIPNTKISFASTKHNPKSTAHEIGHIAGFCEQYSLWAYVYQDRDLRRRYSNGIQSGMTPEQLETFSITNGCTNHYPVNFDVSGGIPSRIYTGEIVYPCYENEMPSCPNLFLVDPQKGAGTVVQNWKNQEGNSYNICFEEEEMNLTSEGLVCDNGGIPLYKKVDCFGRIIRNSAGQETGRGIMGPADSTLRAFSAQLGQGTSSVSERYFDCFEKERFQEIWGCE